MKKTVTLFSAFVLALCSWAQVKLPAFGDIDKADLEMKTCDFDPDTDALYLLDIGDTKIINNIDQINVLSERRIRIKILKERGIQEADIKIPYYSKEHIEEITGVKGYAYNLDDAGNIVIIPLEQSMIFDKKIDGNYSVVSFAFPNVKVGTVVEFKYTTYKKSGYLNVDDWYFQKNKAVKYSAFHLTIPSFIVFTQQVTHRQEIEIKQPVKDGEGIWYIMWNIPALNEEPYQAGLKDYIQRVDFQLTSYQLPGSFTQNLRTSWEKLTDELLIDEFFGLQLRKKIPGLEDIKAGARSAIPATEKMILIYKYVQQNMDWNGLYRRASYDGIKQAWDKKRGTTGDINLILLSLLKDAGLTAYPCLVSTRENGKVNTTYPFLDQFNAMYVYVLADGKPFILNAADKLNPAGLIPYEVQNTYGFIVDKKSGGFATLTDNNQKQKHAIALHIQVDEQGHFNGEGFVSSFDYSKNIRTKMYREGKLKDALSQNESITLKIDSMAVTLPEKDAGPMEQKINFSGDLPSSGEYTFIPFNLFTGLTKNPFIAEKRQTDIDFGCNQKYTVTGGYTIAGNYEFEELPKNMTMIMPDTSIVVSRMMQKLNNTVNFRITMDFRRPQYTTEEYPDLKAFYKKLFALINEQIVIKKKK